METNGDHDRQHTVGFGQEAPLYLSHTQSTPSPLSMLKIIVECVAGPTETHKRREGPLMCTG